MDNLFDSYVQSNHKTYPTMFQSFLHSVMSPWSREDLGWGDSPTIISSNGQYTVHEAGAPCDNCVQTYKITEGFANNEYLLIENRQRSGFESTNPGEGLVIYHIDNLASYTTEGFPGQTDWPSNGNHYVSRCFSCHRHII